MEKNTKKNNTPIKVFRAGQINASVWAKEVEARGKTFTAYSVKIVKSYKDEKEYNWKETNNFNPQDIGKIQYVSQQAYEYLITMIKVDPEDD